MEMKRNEREKKRNTDSQTREIYVVYVRENSNELNTFSDEREREIETRRLFTRRCNKVDTARTKSYIYCLLFVSKSDLK